MSNTNFALDYDKASDTYNLRALKPVLADHCTEFRRLLDTVAGRNPHRVILDLSEIPMIVSAALHVLLDFRPSLDREQLVIRCAHPDLAATLRLCYLDIIYQLETETHA